MYHSVIISGQNTYTSWGLVPKTRPVINPPNVKTEYFDLVGAHGQLDFSEVLLGEVPVGSCEGTWEFYLRPGRQWGQVYSSLLTYIHGVEHTVVLEDDPERSYKGRLMIDSWTNEAYNTSVVIKYKLEEITEEEEP